MRNMIFDMGNVLIRFDPEHFLDREGVTDPKDRELLLKEVFRSPEWPMLDSGAMDEPDLEALMAKRLPERLLGVAHRLIFDWNDPIDPIPGMPEFVRECHGRGMGVYLLSNASRRQKEYWPDIPGSECFDGAVVSAFERCVKPMPEIYRILLDRYGLRAEDCFFVDDVPVNVSGGEAAGMTCFQFTGDVAALREAVRAWEASRPEEG